jgi:hypothetical protein
MNHAVKPNDLVELEEDIPAHNLVHGRLGRILEVRDKEHCLVQFNDGFDKNVLEIILTSSQFTLPYEEATLTEKGVWQLIEQSKAEALGNPKPQYELLTEHLTTMPVANIVVFGDYIRKFSRHAYRGHLWAAAYVICGGCSDDGFMDFRDWLISRGEAIYHEALRDPETLLDIVPLIVGEYGVYGDARHEGLSYICWTAYERKMGVEYLGFRYDEINSPILGPYIHQKPDNMDWDEDTVYKMYPKLTTKFAPYAAT